MVVPAEGEELLRSWESLLSQTETSPSGSPEVTAHEDDIAAELLDSLINGIHTRCLPVLTSRSLIDNVCVLISFSL